MTKKQFFLIFSIFLGLLVLFLPPRAFAFYCGDPLNECDYAAGENCDNCSQDCGVCPGGSTPPPLPSACDSLSDCGVIAGCDCYQQPEICQNCDNQYTCGVPRLCPDGTTWYNTYCTCPVGVSDCCNYIGRVCHNTPSCPTDLGPDGCKGAGGDAYCTASAAGRDDWCGPNTVSCAVHKCNPGDGTPNNMGGNCYVECNNCTNATHLICEGTSCVSKPLSVSGTSCTQSSQCGGATHKACRGTSCVSVDGAATDSCVNNSQCSLPSTGILRGQIWNDLDCGGDEDEVTDGGGNPIANDPDWVRNPFTACPGRTFTNAAAWISYTGNQNGVAVPYLCDAIGPYYSVNLIPGSYLVNVNPPTGWRATTTTQTKAVTAGGTVTARFGICQDPPACQIVGDTQIQLGYTGNWSARADAPGGGDANVEIAENTNQLITGSTRIVYSDCGGTASSCTASGTWTPPAEGTYYVFCRGYNGTRECRPFENGTDYPDCGPNDWLTVQVLPAGPWWQSQDGDVHAQGTITSIIPPGFSPPHLSRIGDGGSPGVVSWGGASSPTLGGAGRISVTDWQAKTNFAHLEDFEYLKNRLNIDTGSPLEAFVDNEIPASAGTKLYYLSPPSGSVDIKGRTIGNNEKIIIFVKGNVTITSDLLVNTGGFLALVGSGNITFGSSVNQAHGFYLASGTIIVASSNQAFTGKGSFLGLQGVVFSRDLGAGNGAAPAEFFVSRPDLYINAPEEFLITPSLFQEMAP